MNIIFKTLTIQGFQSIGNESVINLNNRGTILIRGINEYETNTLSNGSGKSSIIESINFCIYGKTSSGVSNVLNRYYKDGCHVIIELSIDNQEYIISRFIKSNKYGTGVKIEKVNNGNREDISGRNKTDTEKIIREIFSVPQDIFLSTVMLSQGFSSRLSTLSPSGRKERIEVLTNTSSLVDNFKDKINILKSKYSNILKEYESNVWKSDGELNIIDREIELCKDEINNSDLSDILKDGESKSSLEDEISKSKNILDSIENDIASLNESKNKIYNIIQPLRSNININNDKISSIESNMLSTESKICPLCHQEISDGISNELMSNYKDEIKTLTENNRIMSNKINTFNERYNAIVSDLDNKNNKKLRLSSYLSELKDKYNKVISIGSKDSYINRLNDLKNNKNDIIIKRDKNKSKQTEYESKVSIVDHCLSIITRQFRSYLLQNIIDFLNSRLLEYSSMLFSNDSDIIKFVADSSKLDIYLGDALYDTLSGGEKRKVDIAITFAQRDLAISMSSFSSNILVLDEILDNLDQKATSVVLDMISNISFNIESMFIISHNNYSMPYDGVIIVRKDKNRISNVETI